jgi:hypothetical protein
VFHERKIYQHLVKSVYVNIVTKVTKFTAGKGGAAGGRVFPDRVSRYNFLFNSLSYFCNKTGLESLKYLKSFKEVEFLSKL